MSSPILSDILQNNAKILEEQLQEIQYMHEEEQQLLVHLQQKPTIFSMLLKKQGKS